MDLARASSSLSAKRGAAVGVARIARLAASAAGQEQVCVEGGAGWVGGWGTACAVNGGGGHTAGNPMVILGLKKGEEECC